MALSRDGLFRLAIEGYFARVMARDGAGVLAALTPDCVMEVMTSGHLYAGRAALAEHFEDFFASFEAIEFADFAVTADPVGQSVAVSFTVTLGGGGQQVVMRNCNFFTLGEGDRFARVRIWTSAPVARGFGAGSSAAPLR